MIKLARRFKPSEPTMVSLAAMMVVAASVGVSHALTVYLHLPN